LIDVDLNTTYTDTTECVGDLNQIASKTQRVRDWNQDFRSKVAHCCPIEETMETVLQIRRMFAVGCLAIACSACTDGQNDLEAPPPTIAPASVSSDSEISLKREQILTLTPRAAERLRMKRDEGKLKSDAVVLISVKEGNFFRLKNGGSKRYRYTLAIDDAPKLLEDSFVMESQGLTIYVPQSSGEFLRGTELHWIEAGGKGGLKFQNPNELQDDESARQELVDPVTPFADPANSKKADGPTLIDE
jgi:Fe-S cluster assembly iron-binding protein IscA